MRKATKLMQKMLILDNLGKHYFEQPVVSLVLLNDFTQSLARKNTDFGLLEIAGFGI